MRRIAALVLLGTVLLLAGCGREARFPTDSLDLAQTLGSLPTQDEFTFTNDTRPADIATVAKVFAPDDTDDTALQQYESLGYRDGVIRTWNGKNGAAMTVLATRWDAHMTAVNTGSGVSEIVPIRDRNARPWTPDELRGTRGAVTPGPVPEYTLSFAIENVGVFVETRGPVSDRTVIRTMELVARQLIAARDGG